MKKRSSSFFSGGFLLVSALLWVMLTSPAHAQIIDRPTDAELPSLPVFCQVKLRPNERASEVEQYTRQVGAMWIHVHHYCWGLNLVNRSRLTLNQQHRLFYLNSAIGEYRYVLDRAARDYWMRPQWNVELADVMNQLGRLPEAEMLLHEALELNPRYVQAYIALIHLQKRTGNTAEVLKTATQGLRYVPNSAALQRHYLEAGGAKPFPTPVAVAPRESRGAAQTERAGRTRAEPATAAAASVEPGTDEATDTAGDSEPQRSGSRPGSNCRFCPPEDVEQRWRDTFQ